MDWIVFVVGMIAGIVIYQVLKHFMVKKIGRVIVFLVVLMVIFVIVSAFLVKNDSFKDNVAIQTGAAIANVFTSGNSITGNVAKESVEKTSSVFNSTFKRE